ncbi:MAG: phosphatidate cytidylyltransferase [Ruminococcus sp.]|nr:phosphatidate cytidylyltransferase [Ruminococcus sp.]
MKTRLISAGIGIVLCIVLMILGEINSIVIRVAIALVTALICGELLTAKGLHKNLKISIPCVAFGLLMPLFSGSLLKYIPIYLFAVIFFTIMVAFHDSVKVEDAMFAFGGTMLLTLSMTSFTLTACNPIGYSSFWIVLTLGVPWLSDSGAYFAGVFLGKHKLCPEISPKKTVEGAFGGLISGTLGSLLIGLVFLLIYKDVTINFIPLLIIGFINPIVSIIGDLSFSVIKRSCGIKDFGSIMPGHGGMLDRFDSIILCAPLVFIISNLFTVIS